MALSHDKHKLPNLLSNNLPSHNLLSHSLSTDNIVRHTLPGDELPSGNVLSDNLPGIKLLSDDLSSDNPSIQPPDRQCSQEDSTRSLQLALCQHTNVVEKPTALLQEDKMERPETSAPSDMLLSLPPELLLLIFGFVGFRNFRQNVRRLHVSRRWYPYARSVLLGNLKWSTRDSLSIFRAMRKNSAALAAAQQLTKHIDLALHTGIPCVETRNRVRPENLEDLERLASILKTFGALRTLVIRSGLCISTMPGHVVSSFASLSQLTSLEMDLMHMSLGTRQHLCESIAQMFPKLKSLRCRLPHICGKLLESPPGNLKELIISINPPTAWARHLPSTSCLPQHCRDHHFLVSYDELRTRLELLLLRFAASMHNPKIVRLIYKADCSLDSSFALDAVKGRRLILREWPDWDEDGVPVEDRGWQADDAVS